MVDTQLNTLIIRLDRELYALPSSAIREVARYRDITPIPGAPAVFPGIISQRGAIIPVADIRPLLGLDTPQTTRSSRLVLLVHEETDVALHADAVLDLTAIDPESVSPAPSAIDPSRGRLLSGIARADEQPVMMIDLGAVIGALRGVGAS